LLLVEEREGWLAFGLALACVVGLLAWNSIFYFLRMLLAKAGFSAE
jgi:hypothetical protein